MPIGNSRLAASTRSLCCLRPPRCCGYRRPVRSSIARGPALDGLAPRFVFFPPFGRVAARQTAAHPTPCRLGAMHTVPVRVPHTIDFLAIRPRVAVRSVQGGPRPPSAPGVSHFYRTRLAYLHCGGLRAAAEVRVRNPAVWRPCGTGTRRMPRRQPCGRGPGSETGRQRQTRHMRTAAPRRGDRQLRKGRGGRRQRGCGQGVRLGCPTCLAQSRNGVTRYAHRRCRCRALGTPAQWSRRWMDPLRDFCQQRHHHHHLRPS